MEEVLKELFERAGNEEITPGRCQISDLQEAISKEQYLQSGGFLTDLVSILLNNNDRS